MLPRKRPHRAASLAALVLLAVTGCATGDAPQSTDSASSPGSPAATAPGSAVSCQDPPATPSSARSFDQVPSADAARGKTFTATIRTSCGDLVLELDGAKAPQTVASFMHLARAGYWKDSPCHRLTAGGGSLSVLQCGDPTGTGTGNPGYGFGIENAPSDGSYPAGTVAMARSNDPNSNGGQFFLTYADSTIPPEYGGYTIFGKVVEGMPVLRSIAQQGTSSGEPDGAPKQPVSILTVTVTEKKA